MNTFTSNSLNKPHCVPCKIPCSLTLLINFPMFPSHPLQTGNLFSPLPLAHRSKLPTLPLLYSFSFDFGITFPLRWREISLPVPHMKKLWIDKYFFMYYNLVLEIWGEKVHFFYIQPEVKQTFLVLHACVLSQETGEQIVWITFSLLSSMVTKCKLW